MSLMYRTQSFGFAVKVPRAFSSSASMYILATTSESGEPILAPSVCSKKKLPNWK